MPALRRLLLCLGLLLGLLFPMGCAAPEPSAPKPPEAEFAWPVGTWRFDKEASKALNRDHAEYAKRSDDVEDGHVTLQITATHIILKERLDDRVDTTRAKIRSAKVSEHQARIVLAWERPLVLVRKGEVIYFTEPNGIKVGLVRAKP